MNSRRALPNLLPAKSHSVKLQSRKDVQTRVEMHESDWNCDEVMMVRNKSNHEHHLVYGAPENLIDLAGIKSHLCLAQE